MRIADGPMTSQPKPVRGSHHCRTGASDAMPGGGSPVQDLEALIAQRPQGGHGEPLLPDCSGPRHDGRAMGRKRRIDLPPEARLRQDEPDVQ
eukprot:13531590-Alexandrium_andersonii.AAC.1